VTDTALGSSILQDATTALQYAGEVDATGTPCCWALVIVAGSSEEAPTVWDAFLRSGNLQDHLCAQLEWMIAELANPTSSLGCGADEEVNEPPTSR
jgi:hypothetical protein